MKSYFETIGRIDPFDVLGVPSCIPRPGRWKVRPMLRLFEDAIDSIISTRRERIAQNPADAPRDILTLLLEAKDPETGEPLIEAEIRANILTFIAAGHETTANCIAWSLFLLSQSQQWRARVQAEADREFNGEIDGLADRLVETRAVIDEANRLYPPIAAISRVALGPDELAGPASGGDHGRHRALCASPASRIVDRARQFRSEPLSRCRRAMPSIALHIFRLGSGRAFALAQLSPSRKHRSSSP